MEALGNEYYALCYKPHNEAVSGYNIFCGFITVTNGKNSEFVVVATEDQTKVTITPSKITDQLKPANIPFTITLNKGELYQVQSMNAPNLTGQGDLTGSFIKSDKPVALYSGSWATTVPNTSTYAWDHLYEQIPPLRSWGRKFVTVPLKSRGKDTYRILASVDQTTVRIANKTTVVLDQGKFYEFMLNENEPSLIECDHPVLLAQFSNSNDVDRPSAIPQGGPWDGDPSMLIISPVDQTRENVTFVAYDTPEITSKLFVNVVTKDDAVNQIQLDNNPISFTSLPNSGYSYAQIQISIGNHNLNSLETGKGFIAYVYGFGGVESYGYGVGFNLSTRLDLGGDIHFVKDTIVLCSGGTKVLDAGAHFSSFLWNTGETTQKISVNGKGFYEVTASTEDGCVLKDGIYALESNPVVDLGKDTTICTKQALRLDAGSGFTSYLWSTNETTRKISASTTGIYSVIAMNQFGCLAKDTLQIGLGSVPKLNLSKLDTLVCGSKTTTVNITADRGYFSLTTNDTSVSVNDMSVAVPQFGSYPFTFTVVDQYGCSADTSFTLGFYKIPSVNFNLDETTCYASPLEVAYLGDADVSQTKFTWVFANDTLVSEIGKDKIQVETNSDQKNQNLYLKVEDKGCINSYDIQGFNIDPPVDFSVSDTSACEQSEVRFFATSSDNVTKYYWEWGDGTGEYLGKDAIHLYQGSGNYNVQLTVTTDKKCSTTISKNDLLFVAPTPTVDFSIKDNQCLKVGPQTLFYTGTGDEFARYNWDLSRLDQEEVIQSPNTTSGPLVFELINKPSTSLSLQVISRYGCKSENKTLNIKRNPEFSIVTDSTVGCAPFQVVFMAKPGDPIDQIAYHWNFGDGEMISGQEVTHIFGQPDQYYDLSVKAISKTTGCSDSLEAAKYILVYPKPKAGFTIDPEIIYIDQPLVSFFDLSSNAVRFDWDFGDGSKSDLKDPSHKYESAGNLKVLQTVYNQFNCSDTTSKDLTVALRKIYTPNAFSPNAVNLIDREFKPFSNGVVVNGYHLKILSRWNDVVFECKNEIKGWNGKLSNGTYAQLGNYIWILEFTDFLGKAHRQTGTVMLIY